MFLLGEDEEPSFGYPVIKYQLYDNGTQAKVQAGNTDEGLNECGRLKEWA